jgi:DNA polymerase-3 subunit epsilon
VHHVPAEEAIRDRPLRALSYVVFDVETTGLKLSEGDAPVSIGAVRVVNGRVLPLETFERLINPGRMIPPDSVRFHGITDAMVQDKPPLSLVLPQFQRFAADSVLVAHNAAFDMLALQRGGATCGVTFGNPVLDSLLISAWLDKEETDHSLDAIAHRFGLPVSARHDAMSDAMLTAAILVRQLERLESLGVEQFGQLVAATDMAARLRANQMQF